MTDLEDLTTRIEAAKVRNGLTGNDLDRARARMRRAKKERAARELERKIAAAFVEFARAFDEAHKKMAEHMQDRMRIQAEIQERHPYRRHVLLRRRGIN